MPIQSMTGFGRGEVTNDDYAVIVEIKSVNHRFRDFRFKMPSVFNSIELNLKKKIQEIFKRGSFDIYINFKKAEAKSNFDDIDPRKVEEYLQLIKQFAAHSGVPVTIHPTEFLRVEFFVDRNLSQDEHLRKLTFEAFDEALKKLKNSRVQEGEKLVSVIGEHKKNYTQYYQLTSSMVDKLQMEVEEKIKKRFEEFKSEVKFDEPRFVQEVIYYMEKLDVDEEINRISSHLEKFDELLSSEGEIGRQIDFLVQEINRETNTIGSKSSLKDVSNSIVQMKVCLEKIREQGLNLE